MPSFIFVMRLSGSVGLSQSSFDTFFPVRALSKRLISSIVGFSSGPMAPLSRIRPVTYSCQFSPVSRRTMLFIAAFASSGVESTPIVLPSRRFFSRASFRTQAKAALWTSVGRRSRITVSDEWSGDSSVDGIPRNFRIDSESLHRQAIPRWDPIPSKYPTNSIRKYTPGGIL